MATFVISENLRPLIREMYGQETITIGKICDFCSVELPIDFPSTNCSRCPTIFDECYKCREWPRPDSTICHKQHSAKQYDNTMFSEKELESIRNALNNSSTVCRIFGQSLLQRQRVYDDEYLEEEATAEHILNVDDANVFRRENLPHIADMIDKGYQFILKGYTDCMIIEIKSPSMYKNIYYRIVQNDTSIYKGFIKIENLDISFCENNQIIRHGLNNKWYVLMDEYSNENDTSKAIHNVIDKIEKQYEPGGIEFEKARTICEKR